MTNENRCILAGVCKLAGTEKCNDLCPAFIAMHGFSGVTGLVGGARVPKAYQRMTLENSPARHEQQKVYKALISYAQTFSRQFSGDSEPIKSLYLFSEEPGTGKTTTATALLNEWMIRHYVGSVKNGQNPLNMPAYFLDVNEWQSYYNKANRGGNSQDVKESASKEYYHRMSHAINAPFAVLDDIGVRSATDGFRGDLHEIINSRVNDEKATVYTSNVPLTDLQKVFDKRLYDRIRDLCVELYFTGDSKRGKR